MDKVTGGGTENIDNGTGNGCANGSDDCRQEGQ